MTKSTQKLTPKVMFLASLGIVIPLLILGIAFLAVKSDAKNQAEYQRIKEQEDAERDAMLNEAGYIVLRFTEIPSIRQLRKHIGITPAMRA